MHAPHYCFKQFLGVLLFKHFPTFNITIYIYTYVFGTRHKSQTPAFGAIKSKKGFFPNHPPPKKRTHTLTKPTEKAHGDLRPSKPATPLLLSRIHFLSEDLSALDGSIFVLRSHSEVRCWMKGWVLGGASIINHLLTRMILQVGYTHLKF